MSLLLESGDIFCLIPQSRFQGRLGGCSVWREVLEAWFSPQQDSELVRHSVCSTHRAAGNLQPPQTVERQQS